MRDEPKFHGQLKTVSGFPNPFVNKLERFDPIEMEYAKYMKMKASVIEAWLQRMVPPLIAEGYRLSELEMIESHTKFRHGEPMRMLLPRKSIFEGTLIARRLWRRRFPYQLPKALSDRIS